MILEFYPQNRTQSPVLDETDVKFLIEGQSH